jgi:hypothetical protein
MCVCVCVCTIDQTLDGVKEFAHVRGNGSEQLHAGTLLQLLICGLLQL